MVPRNAPLRVAVVGGGLGGLAVSAALRQQGHTVEIFEASDTNTELGLGITVPPNGGKALEALGYRPENILPLEWKETIFIYQGDHPQVQFDMQYFPSTFGQYWNVCSRRALHCELKRLAFSEQRRGSPCIIHLSSSTVSCDPEQGTITLKDGRTLQFDLVIGADGIRSRIRQSINPSLAGPPVTGICAFRFTLEKRLLESLPGSQWIMHEGQVGPRILLAPDRRHIFMYAIKCPERGEVLNVAVMCEDQRDQSRSKWRVDVPREAMLTKFSDFDAKWQQFLGLAPSIVTLWQLRALDPLQSWSRGKACILGDAAHAMFQILGQGAAQAFEDAAVLGTLLPLGTPKCEIPSILNRYELIRKPRVHAIQNLSTQEMLSPFKRTQYICTPELQIPVMGYDVLGELTMSGRRHKIPFVFEKNEENEVGPGSPLVPSPKMNYKL